MKQTLNRTGEKKNKKDRSGYLFSNQALRKLIIPLVAEQALAISVGMADTMMISNAGEAAVSGVSLVDMINMLIFSIFAALATGGAVVTSQFIGAKKEKEACRSAKQLVYTVFFVALIVTALMILARKPVLRLFFGKIEDDVMKACLTYLVISAFSYPFLALYNAGAALFRSMGKSNVTFYVSIIINLINVAGNAICVFGLKMGVAGVAIPSLVSRLTGCVIILLLLRNPDHQIHFEREKYRPDFTLIRKILYIGIPSGIENGIFQLGRIIVVSIIAGFGTVQIAANGVANSLDAMGCIIGQGMNLAMITVIGQCVGANDEEQVRYYTKKLLAITYISTAILNTIILALLHPILSLYGLSAETEKLAYLLVFIHNLTAIICWPSAFVFPNMLRACNDVRYTMVVSIASMVIFRIGFAVVFGIMMDLKALGIWYAMILDWLVRIAFFYARYFSGAWRRTANFVKNNS